MGIIRKILGAKSKYDFSLPYTYLAKVPIIEGFDELFSYYYSDTLCGLIELLNDENVLPKEVKLFGIYNKGEIELDKTVCTDKNEKWLLRPDLCNALEEYFNLTKNELYKGHKELEECSFEDRDRAGEGPF